MFKEEYFGKGKEHRKSYHGSKAVDKTCRCHGTCDWCKANRLYSFIKNLKRTDDELKNGLLNAE